jgi:hypothetical protein
MEKAISKQKILNTLDNGHWILDDLSSLLLKKFKEEQLALNFDENCLKNYVISYYCYYKSPLNSLFYCPQLDEKFNRILVEKVSKEGRISFFTDLEISNILSSLNDIKESGTGNFKFINELSFIKMESLQFKSASNPHLIGTIILTNQINFNKIYELSKSIIHELAHQELFLINFYDRLILESSDGVSKFSPYQKTVRPPIGRLHSLWALFRMVQYGRFQGGFDENEMLLFNQTIQTLEDKILTDFGVNLVKTIKDYLEKKI